MKKRPFVARAIAGLFLAAACAPAIRPEYQMATDKALTRYPANHRVYPALARFRGPRWVVGQWAQFKVESKGEPSVMRIAVVGHDARGWWIETESQGYRHHSISKVCYARQPKTAEEAGDLLQVIVSRQDDQKEQVSDFSKMEGPGGDLVKSMMKKTLQGVVVTPPEGAPREDVTVAAGTFKGSFKFHSEGGFGPFRSAADAWIHPDVYLNGLVRSVAEGGESSMDLLAFGTGAVSALPNLP